MIQTIGERLSELRKDFGMNQTELAEKLSLTRDTISAYERNKFEPPDSTKLDIARFFNVSIDYLLGLTNTPNPYKNQDNYIKLPKDFPKSGKSELMNYANYLIYKSKKS